MTVLGRIGSDFQAEKVSRWFAVGDGTPGEDAMNDKGNLVVVKGVIALRRRPMSRGRKPLGKCLVVRVAMDSGRKKAVMACFGSLSKRRTQKPLALLGGCPR